MEEGKILEKLRNYMRRKLNEISGASIILFLVIAISYSENNLQRGFIASGALLTGICMAITKLKRTKHKKRRGFLKG